MNILNFKKMKKIYFAFVLALLSIGTTFGQTKTEKFKVYGNCDLCKSKIEKAALGTEGVTTANWNKESKMIVVSFNTKKTTIHKIHMAIAKVGYDTEMCKAKDETYNALPGCCKYERAPLKKEKK